MFHLELPVLVKLRLGVLHLPLDLLLRFFLPEPFGGRRGLQHLMAADAGAGTGTDHDTAGAVPKRFRIVQLVLETRVSVAGEHRFCRFRCHRRGVVSSRAP